jgi:hypothetical protein
VIVGYLLLGYLKGGLGQSKTNCDRVQGKESNLILLLKFVKGVVNLHMVSVSLSNLFLLVMW